MTQKNPIDAKEITVLILAGGRARRMGGLDKGLLDVAGKPAIEHVLARLQKQSSRLLISANRNLEQYAAYGHPVVPDRISGFPGPLAGMLAGLDACKTRYLLTVPVDSPLLSDDYLQCMKTGMENQRARACVAECNGALEPVFCLLERGVKESLAHYLEQDQRSVRDWLAQINAATVDCSDFPDQFSNLNDPDELRRFGDPER